MFRVGFGRQKETVLVGLFYLLGFFDKALPVKVSNEAC